MTPRPNYLELAESKFTGLSSAFGTVLKIGYTKGDGD